MTIYIFWLSVAIIAYSYLLYSLVLYAYSALLRKGEQACAPLPDEMLPELTLFIAAYNEAAFVPQKVQNSMQLLYPSAKLKHVWVTDGSDDGTPELIRKLHPQATVMHQDKRNGKIGAINRGMAHISTDYAVFCDANTMLNPNALREIASVFAASSKVGCVAGEKRIAGAQADTASGAGEGIYWKYESFIKKHESLLGSTMGAAGELFAVRTELLSPVEPDTLLDDFMISMRIAAKGYYVKYCPAAYASELPSANVKEELKRKIRIASGGLQSTIRLRHLLSPFRYPQISFKFISHKILRWLIAPYCFIAAFASSFILAADTAWAGFYAWFFYAQLIFYASALAGKLAEEKKMRAKIFFVPYYIFIMNYAAVAGALKYMLGKQSVNWARAKRASA
jgi:cellulose synthase/poly-beta-1,6-N-acetylglucosamine synthase-like glycosyltransferase